MRHRKRANLKAAKLISIYTIIFTTNIIGSSDPKPSNNNTGVIVGGVMAVLVVIVTVVLIVTCFRYRQVLKKENYGDVGRIQNAVYDEDTQLDTLPQAHHTDGDHEQPAAEYAQLDSSKRVPVDENYQSLNVEGYDQLQKNPNENVPQYTSLNMKRNDNKRTPEEPTYEEIP